MLAADIPIKIQTPFAVDAGPTLADVIPQTTLVPGRASWTFGFPSTNFTPLAAGGIPPFGQDMNGVLLAISSWLQWSNAGGGVLAYDATFSSEIGGYPQGAVVQSTTGNYLWISTADNNTTNPDTPGTNWQQLTINIPPYAGNPNGNIAGVTGGANGLSPSFIWDSAHKLLWVCTTTGNAAGAVWSVAGGQASAIWCGTSTGSANAQVVTVGLSLQAFGAGASIAFEAGYTNTGAATLAVGSFGTFPFRRAGLAGPVALVGGEIVVGNINVAWFDGSYLQLIPTALGTAAQANASSATGVVAAVSGAFTVGHFLAASDTAGTAVDGGIPAANILLNTLTASNSAFLADTTSLTATYSYFIFVIENLTPFVNHDTLLLQISYDGGATYKSASYISSSLAFDNSATASYGDTAYLCLVHAGSDTGVSGGVSGLVNVTNPASSTFAQWFWWQTTRSGGGVFGFGGEIGAGNYYDGSLSAINAFKIFYAGGVSVSGVVKIYGVP